jgi:hypothetical protein
MRRIPPVLTVQQGSVGRGRASVASLAGLDPVDDAPTPFDPGEHNIGDVQTYVDGHADELDAILAAELDGKNRTTLIEWLESHAGSSTEPS